MISLGASIFEAVRDGHRVAVVTVFAGDPDSATAAGRWDTRTGFETAGEAVRSRREEDRNACALLGAEPLWLPFVDGDYGGERSEEEISAKLIDLLAPFNAVLVPGRPLRHADHLWLARCVEEHGIGSAQLGLYAELPYDYWPKQDRGTEASVAHDSLVWRAPRVTLRARLTKWRACSAYSSQLPWLGRGRFRPALLRARVGGERTAWAE